jgi:hypothetical protein
MEPKDPAGNLNGIKDFPNKFKRRPKVGRHCGTQRIGKWKGLRTKKPTSFSLMTPVYAFWMIVIITFIIWTSNQQSATGCNVKYVKYGTSFAFWALGDYLLGAERAEKAYTYQCSSGRLQLMVRSQKIVVIISARANLE